jgi:hypothetical protein
MRIGKTGDCRVMGLLMGHQGARPEKRFLFPTAQEADVADLWLMPRPWGFMNTLAPAPR